MSFVGESPQRAADVELGRELPRVLVIDDNLEIHHDFRKIFIPARRATTDSELENQLFGTALPPQSDPTEFRCTLEFALQGELGAGAVASARAAGQPFAVAFVDMRMPPGWDGLETIGHLIRIDPEIQVVLCTAYSDHSWSEIRRTLNAADRLLILKKPFDPVEVLQLASTLCAKWQTARALSEQMQKMEQLVLARTQELRKTEQRYRLIAENAGDIVAVLDRAYRISYRSCSFGRSEGLRRVAVGETLESLVHPSDWERVKMALDRSVSENLRECVEFRPAQTADTAALLEGHMIPFGGTLDSPDSILFVAHDVTQQRAFESQLRAGQKMESLGRLASGIAHEINTPAQFVANNLDFLTNAVRQIELSSVESAPSMADIDWAYLAKEIPRSVRESKEGIERIARIVGCLREFSHPGSGDLSPCDLNRIIDTSVNICRHEWKHVAALAYDLDASLPPVNGVADALTQVFINLLVNAAHAIVERKARAPGAGVIRIRTRRSEGWAIVDIEDNGTGIPDEVKSRIFEPFFTTKPVGHGSGQGLFFVHRAIVQQHRGNIDVAAVPEGGTRFTLRLPLAPAA